MKKIILIAISAVLAFTLFSCGNLYVYPEAEKYSSGDSVISDEIKNIDIDWIAGNVEIKYGDTEKIEISESGAEKSDESHRLRWRIDKYTLKIKYAASMVECFTTQKELTVVLPEKMKLEKITVDTTSADVNCKDIIADTAEFSSTSGDIEVTGAQMKNFDAQSTSGKIKAGKISAKTIMTESTSGKVSIECTKTPENMDVESTSGDVTVKLPENAGFTADIDTSSGKFESDIPVKMNKNSYIAGDGSAQFKIETTSGDVKITK